MSIVSGWYVELLLLVGILSCAFALVALAGWRVGDPTLLEPGTGRVENPCGPVGALLADLLYLAVGWGAWAVLIPGALCALALAGRQVVQPARWLLAGALYVSGLGVLHLVLRPGAGFPPGGLLGRGVGEGLEAVVGPVGAWLVLGGAILLVMTMLLRIEWSAVFASGLERVERLGPHVKGAGSAAGGAVAGVAVGGVRGLGRLLWALVRAFGRWLHGLGAEIGGGFRRMGDALGRVEVERSELAYATASGASYLDEEDDDGLPPSDATPTAAGGVAALAEVEWEPTVMDRSSSSEEVLGMFPELEPRRPKTDPEAERPSRRAVARTKTRAPVVAPPAAVEVELDEDEPEDAHSDPYDAPVPGSLPGVNHAVVVHKNELLGARVSDDGGAVRKAAWTEFQTPALSLLDEVPEQKAVFDDIELQRLAMLVEEKLASFKIGGRIMGVRPGPVVTIFEFLPEAGVKVSRIAALADDLAMALRAVSVRIVAPIPGKGVVGIEIPSPKRMTIYLRELLASPEFRDTQMALPCIIGKDVEGRPMVADLAAMPHLLVGGTTGSGKSVGVNGMLMSLLFTCTPEDLRFLLVDPKKLEFEMYHGIPHLLYPVMTEPKEASAALAWACREMDDRYEILARWGTRNIIGYNKKIERELKDWTVEKARKYAPKGWTEEDGPLSPPKKLPYIVIVIDELADLMMVAGKEVEESICRIAQKARACGIHLVVATQRPSVDVITGLIKANLPTRISFQLRTRTDSRTVLDQMGAEALLGRGDLLYLPPGVGNLMRCHGAFVSDEEVGRVTDFLRAQAEPDYVHEIVGAGEGEEVDLGERDELYDSAVRIVVQLGKASTSLVQRHLKIGYNRAANIIDQMEAAGVVGPADGARPREVLIGAVDLD